MKFKIEIKNITWLLTSISILLIITFALISWVDTEKQLSDCQFECNHLQTKLDWYEELNDIVPALSQIIPPLALAELKVATLQIRNMKHKAYEGEEMPLI